MNKVYMTRFGKRGNCLAACMASLLNIDLHKIDFSCADYPPGGWLSVARVKAWAFGHLYIASDLRKRWYNNKHYIAHGPAERGLEHACVYKDGELVHDPYGPHYKGLLSVSYTSIMVPISRRTDAKATQKP